MAYLRIKMKTTMVPLKLDLSNASQIVLMKILYVMISLNRTVYGIVEENSETYLQSEYILIQMNEFI